MGQPIFTAVHAIAARGSPTLRPVRKPFGPQVPKLPAKFESIFQEDRNPLKRNGLLKIPCGSVSHGVDQHESREEA